TAGNQSTRIAMPSPQAGRFEATIPPPLVAGQTGKVILHIRASPRGAEPFLLVKGPWSLPVTSAAPAPSPPPAPPAANSHNAATGAVRTFLVLNGILVLVGGSGYGLYRYRIQRQKVSHARNADVGSPTLDRSLSSQ